MSDPEDYWPSDPEDYWPESGFRERGFVPDDDFGWHDDKDEE